MVETKDTLQTKLVPESATTPKDQNDRGGAVVAGSNQTQASRVVVLEAQRLAVVNLLRQEIEFHQDLNHNPALYELVQRGPISLSLRLVLRCLHSETHLVEANAEHNHLSHMLSRGGRLCLLTGKA